MKRISEQIMKPPTVLIDGMMSIFDGAGIEKLIKRRSGVVMVDANIAVAVAVEVAAGSTEAR